MQFQTLTFGATLRPCIGAGAVLMSILFSLNCCTTTSWNWCLLKFKIFVEHRAKRTPKVPKNIICRGWKCWILFNLESDFSVFLFIPRALKNDFFHTNLKYTYWLNTTCGNMTLGCFESHDDNSQSSEKLKCEALGLLDNLE